MRTFTSAQVERYSRNILLREVGPEGQDKILNACVLIIGAGGLGSPAALYLAAAGVGTIGIADGDRVDLTNLQRQIIHSTPDVGRPKTESASEKMLRLNPDITVPLHPFRLDPGNIRDVISGYDFVIDGTDNFPSKFLINDACVMAGKPFSHGGVLRYYGQSLTYVSGHACLRCLFPEPPAPGESPSCSEAGVLGVTAGFLGTLQAAEALKFILGMPGLLTDVLFHFDIQSMNFGSVKVKANPRCPLCGNDPVITELSLDARQECAGD